MAQQTIGQVLRTAREDLGLSVSDVYSSLKIHRRYIRSMEKDRFDLIPGETQARTLLSRYAEFLELDLLTILEAYDAHEPLMVYQLPASDPRYVRLSRKKRPTSQTYLPLFYLLIISVFIIIFIIYSIWQYNKETPTDLDSANISYQIYSPENPDSAETHSLSDESEKISSSESDTLSFQITPENVLEISNAPEQIEIDLSVDHSEIWVALSNTSLAEGMLLTAEKPSVSVTLEKSHTQPIVLSLGTLSGLNLKINEQSVDLSQLPIQATTITFIFK